MDYHARSGTPEAISTDCLVLGIYEYRQMSNAAKTVDASCNGAIKDALRTGDQNGKSGEILILYGVPGIKAKRVLLLGLGRRKSLTPNSFGATIGAAVRKLDQSGAKNAVITIPGAFETGAEIYSATRGVTLEVANNTYSFNQCKSEKQKSRAPLKKITLITENKKHKKTVTKALGHGQAMANGMALTKDLSNLPGNICTPTYLAEQAKKLAGKSNKLKTSVLSEASMKRLGMGSLLSVSRGSRQPAKLIVMNYQGGKSGAKPVVLVGKGLTFDAGGISIKPSAKMDEMKYDMCGGASVFGVITACIEMELPLNVVGIVPASENLPDGEANKPGDIVTSMAGLTIEVLNTDAEGRLILCDALTYAERFNPATVIDIATLTGACVVALGHHTSGLLANDDKLADELMTAGQKSGDAAWRLPITDDYMKQLDSNFADMANIGGPAAGTITAACFLSRFTEKYKWAHLDIAGTAWKGGAEKGATGRPVPMLVQMLLRRCKLAD